MRIGLVGYPMLLRRDAAVQRQVRDTVAALLALRTAGAAAPGGKPRVELRVELLDAGARLAGYDVIHAFSATHGNHAIVEAAGALGVPVVLSPLVSGGWGCASGVPARPGERRQRAPDAWRGQSGYLQTRRALQLAARVLACGAAEKAAITAHFPVEPAKIRLVNRAIGAQFFGAGGELFRQRSGIHGAFALMAGPICPYLDQLGMAHALAGLALPLVLVGAARGRDHDYLRQVRAVRGVILAGALRADSAMLASAVAAASVYLLPRHAGAAPLTAHDALACGTPVVFGAAGAAAAIERLLAAAPARDQVRALVRGHTWQQAGADIAACYVELAGGSVAETVVPEVASASAPAAAAAAAASMHGGLGLASASYTAT